tara:strand:+ start:346 stop:846 length:501 start_codon:yes stop_codon:yes gene_type:complete
MKKIRLIKLTIIASISFIIITPIKILGEDKKFELKKINIEKKEEQSDRPLFDMINDNQPDFNLQNNNKTKWGNNPFFNEQPQMIQAPTPTEPEITQTTMNLFEYKITAVWVVNERYKVLISGHILEEGDTLNNVTIKKISTKEITVEKNKNTQAFRLGSIFYDFQI